MLSLKVVESACWPLDLSPFIRTENECSKHDIERKAGR